MKAGRQNVCEKGGEKWEPGLKESYVVIPAFATHHLSDTSRHSSNGIIHTKNQWNTWRKSRHCIQRRFWSCSSGLIMEVHEDGNTATLSVQFLRAFCWVKWRPLVNSTRSLKRFTSNPGGIRDKFWMMFPQTGVSADKEKSKSWPHGDEEPTLL